MKRAQLVDWEWMRQETASGRQSARLPVVVKSGREASVAATEWVACLIRFHSFHFLTFTSYSQQRNLVLGTLEPSACKTQRPLALTPII